MSVNEELSEHSHEAHNPFDRRVAVTMAIVAALLAIVSVAAHIASTEELLAQQKASDQWAYYQAKNNRNHEYKAELGLLEVLPEKPGSESQREKIRKEWSDLVAKYNRELPEQKATAEELDHKAEESKEEARHKLDESEEVHHRGDRFDLAELAVELALVLCSLAVLTKRASFWSAGIVICIVGLIIATTVVFMH